MTHTDFALGFKKKKSGSQDVSTGPRKLMSNSVHSKKMRPPDGYGSLSLFKYKFEYLLLLTGIVPY